MIEAEKEFSHLEMNLIKEQQWLVKIKLYQSIAYFQGHFPEQAVFPAVALLDLSQVAVQKATGYKQLDLVEVARSKFMAPIFAEQIIEGQIDLNQETEDICHAKILWTSVDSQQKVAQLNLKFKVFSTL